MSKLNKGVIKYFVSLAIMSVSFYYVISSAFDVGYELGSE